MSNKLFMTALAATLAIPAVVVPMVAASENVDVEQKSIGKVASGTDFADTPKPEPKPAPPPEPEPEPAPEPTPVTTTGWIYENTVPDKIKRPDGYVAGTHESAQAEEHDKLFASNGHTAQGQEEYYSVNLDYKNGSRTGTMKEYLAADAKDIFGISYDKLIEVLNYVVETGKVYDGGTYAFHYDYATGMYHYSYRHLSLHNK